VNAATLNAVTLSGPAAAVANIPAMVGFTPKDSVVAIWLKDGSVLVTQRADLIPCLNDPHSFFSPMRKHQPDEVILTFWTDKRIDSDDDSVLSFIEYGKADVFVRDAMWIANGRWGSLVCDDSECCPPAGREIDPCLKAQELPDPIADRDDLLAEVNPKGTERMKPLDPHGIEGWRDKQIDRIIEAWTVGGFESEKHVIRAGRALHDVRVRDTIAYLVCDLTPDQKRDAYDLAATVARSMHPLDAAPACTVAALLAWLSGDGARANIAIDYAQRCDPDYSLAMLLSHSLAVGLPPSAWAESMSTLSYDDVRHGTKR
jgi:hypothetical protein